MLDWIAMHPEISALLVLIAYCVVWRVTEAVLDKIEAARRRPKSQGGTPKEGSGQPRPTAQNLCSLDRPD